MTIKKYWQNRHSKLILLSIFAVVMSFQNSVYAQSAFHQLAKETIEKFPDDTEFAIGMISNGQKRFIGLKKTTQGIEAVRNETDVFQIGSISKVFTSVILASLAEKDKIDMEMDTSKLYDTLYNHEITLKSLANHTSGLDRLPDNFAESAAKNRSNPYMNYSQKELYAYLNSNFEFNPAVYNYSNLGYGLLGHSLEKITEKPYEELLQEEILTPLDMNLTTSNPSDTKNRVKALDKDGYIAAYWTFDALKGVGGIFSSSSDLLKFLYASTNQTHPGIYLSLKETLKISDREAIALGWHILNTKSGKRWIWQNGAVGGFTSCMVTNPETGNAVVVLSNVSAFHEDMQRIDKLCFDSMQELEKKK
ncbi:MAG: serine hydrolase domain-containing protein [Flavobacteriaceae bacterium]|nr:beta-lactamase family protein [Psychroflexus sp.]